MWEVLSSVSELNDLFELALPNPNVMTVSGLEASHFIGSWDCIHFI